MTAKSFRVRFDNTYIVRIFLAVIAAAAMAIVFFAGPTHAAATQVSTGDASACAVDSFKAKCWGNNASGQLGNRSETNSNKPVAVDTRAAYVEKKGNYCKGGSLGSICFGVWIPSYDVNHKASGLNGKSVTKVSVGKDHACALADARVYCWGDNSSGELGNSTTKSSSFPVAVDDKSSWTETIPGYCSGEPNALTGCGAPTGTWVAEQKIVHGDSAIKNKEIIDISAGEDFTCALASDGLVACWGNGGNGRLGNNNTVDSKFPVAVYSKEGSTQTSTVTVNAQTGAELKTCGRASDNARLEAERQQCLAERQGIQTREETRTTVTPPAGLYGKKGTHLAKASGKTMCVIAKGAGATTAGTPYCWGNGIDDGTGIPANGSAPTACDKNSPTSKPSATSKTTIFDSSKPVAVSGATIASMDGDAYVTGLGTDGKSYYWGQYGYKQDVTYSNIKTCKVNPCTGKVTIQINSHEDIALVAYKQPTKARQTQTRIKASNAQNAAKNSAANMGGTASGRDVYDKDGNYSHGYKDGRNNSSSCTLRTHYSFTKNTVNTSVGQKVTTAPPSWPQSQAGISVVSGNVYDGLFCAVVGGSAQCDAHGGNTKTGQLGNGKTTQLSGPQAVVSNGWLAGKQISQLSTGKTGYTCAVAGSGVGCWGVNNKGQLGVGDTTSKNVPTEVRL